MSKVTDNTVAVLKSIFDTHKEAATYHGAKLAGDGVLNALRLDPSLGNDVMLSVGIGAITNGIPANTVEHKMLDFVDMACTTSVVSRLMETFGQMPIFTGVTKDTGHDLVKKAMDEHMPKDATNQLAKRFSQQVTKGIVASATTEKVEAKKEEPKEKPSAANATVLAKPSAEDIAKAEEAKTKDKKYGPKDTYVCPKCGAANKFKKHRRIDLKHPESVAEDIAKHNGLFVCQNCAKVMEAADATAAKVLQASAPKSEVVTPEVLPPAPAEVNITLPAVSIPAEAQVQANAEAELLLELGKEESALAGAEAMLKKLPDNSLVRKEVEELRLSVQSLRGILDRATR